MLYDRIRFSILIIRQREWFNEKEDKATIANHLQPLVTKCTVAYQHAAAKKQQQRKSNPMARPIILEVSINHSLGA